MNEKFKIAEMMEAVDPIAEMEKTLGKRWDQCSDSELNQILFASMGIFAGQRLANEMAGDTTMQTRLGEAESILQGLGFQIGWMSTRTSRQYSYKEKEAIWCRPDGLAIYMETYSGNHVNKINLFGEIKPDFSNENYYYNVSRVCSGGGSYGMYPSGFDIPVEKKNIEFNADCRTGLRRRISIIPEVGTLIPVWENTGKFLWFLNYDEEKVFKNQEYVDITKAKFRDGTPMLKAIVKKFL